MSFVATHNSYAYGNQVAATQNYNIEIQLKDGVRVFLLAALKNPDPTRTDIVLCHTSCELLNAGTVTNTLKYFTVFLQNNPNDIITIFWRNDFSNLTSANFKTAFDEANLTSYCYTQPLGADWPTMASIIKSGKRVINFLDSGADDKRLPLYMMNHFLYSVISGIEIPARSIVNVTNSVSLSNQAQNCTNIFRQFPNFIAVDFYDQGTKTQNVFSVVANYNGVPYVPQTYGNGSLLSTTNSANIIIKNSLFNALISLLLLTLSELKDLCVTCGISARGNKWDIIIGGAQDRVGEAKEVIWDDERVVDWT
ncbi:6998_t:CDS:2, partial [Scutellospora calospora]